MISRKFLCRWFNLYSVLFFNISYMNCGLLNSFIFTLFFSLFKIGVGFQSFDLGFWFNSIVVKTKRQSFCDFNPVKSATYVLEPRSFILFWCVLCVTVWIFQVHLRMPCYAFCMLVRWDGWMSLKFSRSLYLSACSVVGSWEQSVEICHVNLKAHIT